MRLAIKRLARAATIAAAIVAPSTTLAATRQPLFATLGEVAFSLATVCSEVEEVRRRITEGSVMSTLARGTCVTRGR